MQEKKKKKRVKIKFIGILFLLFVVGGLGYLFCCVLPQNINNIYIFGNNILSDQEIIELANIQNYPNFYQTSSANIIKRIKTNVFIKNVKVTKKLGRKIYITIEENKTLFKRLDNNTYVLSNGYEYSYDQELGVAVLINYVPNLVYAEFIEKMNTVDDNVFNKISEIKYSPSTYDDERFALYMDDGNLVYITLDKIDLLDKYNKIVQTLNNQTGTLNLDAGNHFEILK